MRRLLGLLTLAALLAPVDSSANEKQLGVLVGYQALTRDSEGDTHGAAFDQVTLGRSVLAGMSLGIKWGDRHYLDGEIVVGPYHADKEQYCVAFYSCPVLQPGVTTDFAVHWALQYSRAFPGPKQSPFLGFGAGGKLYNYDESGGGPDQPFYGALALHIGAGIQWERQSPIRFETRLVIVRDNPFLRSGSNLHGESPTQVELQFRVGLRFRLH